MLQVSIERRVSPEMQVAVVSIYHPKNNHFRPLLVDEIIYPPSKASSASEEEDGEWVVVHGKTKKKGRGKMSHSATTISMSSSDDETTEEDADDQGDWIVVTRRRTRLSKKTSLSVVPPSSSIEVVDEEETPPPTPRYCVVSSSPRPQFEELYLATQAMDATTMEIATNLSYWYQYAHVPYDLDEQDADDVTCTTALVRDLYAYHRETEGFTSVPPHFLKHHPELDEGDRSSVIGWLVQIQHQYGFLSETLYLAVNLLDRFLERQQEEDKDDQVVHLQFKQLRLVGVTCLRLAAKYEEEASTHPPMNEWLYICGYAYTISEILDMEYKILTVFHYRITVPLPPTFLLRFLKAGQASKEMVQIAWYLLDTTLLSYKLLKYLPSQLAAAVVFLARQAIGRPAWSPWLLQHSGYLAEEIAPIARDVVSELKASSSSSTHVGIKAVYDKYSSRRYGCVAPRYTPQFVWSACKIVPAENT